MVNQFIANEIAQVMPTAYGLGIFVSFASFVAPVQTQGATGNSIGGYTAIAGLQNIPCMNAPERPGMVGNSSNEKRSVSNIQAERGRELLLNGYFQQLDTGYNQAAGLGWQVIVQDPDGIASTYQFFGGEGDSQQIQTRCRLMLVTL
jgi:hypothetical protein